MKIMVTGGAGYIGSHTVKELLKQGHEVIVFDSLENGYREAIIGGKFVKGDLADKELLDKLFKKEKIDSVIHFAAYADVPDSVANPGKYFINNISNGLNLLEAMRKHGVKKIVFSSSAAVYGIPKRVPIQEEDIKKPTNPYGYTKLVFERILDYYDHAYGLRSVSLRYFCAAGADPERKLGEFHRPENHLIPRVLLAALGKLDHVDIFGTDYNTRDGTGVRDFIHVTDLARAHILALRYLDNGGKTEKYNLGSERGFSVREIIETARKVTGLKIKVIEKPRRAGDPDILVASSKKIRRELGWSLENSSIDTIIRTAFNWFKSHPNGYAK
jgi:UDP-glucose 4-epimerase